jgi:hypothetical protein
VGPAVAVMAGVVVVHRAEIKSAQSCKVTPQPRVDFSRNF